MEEEFFRRILANKLKAEQSKGTIAIPESKLIPIQVVKNFNCNQKFNEKSRGSSLVS